jgi:hypothetical protein
LSTRWSPGGDPATVSARLKTQLTAGADHVSIMLSEPSGDPFPVARWQELATALLG